MGINDPTQEEIVDAYMNGIDLEEEVDEFQLWNEAIDRFDAIAEAMGY